MRHASQIAQTLTGLWKFGWVVKWSRIVNGITYDLEIPFDCQSAAESFFRRIDLSAEKPLKTLVQGDYLRRAHPEHAIRHCEKYSLSQPETHH